MGICQSGPTDPEEIDAKARNALIDSQLKKDKALARNEIKMLLLGAGESGKSTVLKQMKFINGNGYNDQERDSYREIIFSNTIQSIRAIVEALPQLELQVSATNESAQSTILSLPAQFEGDTFDPVVAHAIVSLWDDGAVRLAVSRAREFQLNDSTTYYFDSMARLSDRNYRPTDQDILRARVKTTGITETTFKNVTALVFLVGLSEYDQLLYEDDQVNRMQEALTIFESIINSKWFVQTSMILFLNKIDLFRQKLPVSPLSAYFPDFTGGSDYNSACKFIHKRFVSLNKNEKKQVYTHLTCATDTNQIRFVLSAIQDIIMKQHLRGDGFM